MLLPDRRSSRKYCGAVITFRCFVWKAVHSYLQTLMLHRASLHLATKILLPTTVRLRASSACAARRQFQSVVTSRSLRGATPLASSKTPLSPQQPKGQRRRQGNGTERTFAQTSGSNSNSSTMSGPADILMEVCNLTLQLAVLLTPLQQSFRWSQIATIIMGSQSPL